MAYVYTITDEHEKALDAIELLLSVPSPFSPAYMKADPIFKPLLGSERLERLFESYRNSPHTY